MKKIALTITLLLTSFTPIAFATDIASGKTIFQTTCASCHGAEGAGDGPVAAALPPEQKPANFQTGVFKKVTDDASMKDVIKKGGAAFGLSALMPAQTSMSEAQVDDLVAYVRSLKK